MLPESVFNTASKNRKKEHVYLGVQTKDDKIRYESTSGGVFPVLAAYVLAKGGVVFGAVMAKDGTVHHKEAHTMEEVFPMRKAKYVQSRLEDWFEKVKRNLEKGRMVLFSGTPCQCRAVGLCFGKEYQNLFLLDMVCYGVPSPGIWRKYMNETEDKYGGKLSDFCFRDKREGDDGHTISFRIKGKEYAYPMWKDAFFRNFFITIHFVPHVIHVDFARLTGEAILPW